MSRTDKFEWFAEANLIYKTATERPYDIAVLKIDLKFKEPSMKAIELADTDAQKGKALKNCILSFQLPASSTSSAFKYNNTRIKIQKRKRFVRHNVGVS